MPGARFTEIRRLDSVDSTNRYLLDEARAGAPEGVVAVAEHQSAGRGRLGRRWEAPPGTNLLASVLLRPELPDDRRYLAGAVVALAAADALTVVCGLSVGIKWPNDLLAADGRKLAGVLAEADVAPRSAASLRPPIVVGIGINVNWPAADADLPPDLVGAATSLRQQVGAAFDRSSVLDAVLEALAERVGGLDTGSGRAGITRDLRERCTTLGTEVRVDLPDQWFEGSAVDLTPAGHLVVEVDGRRRTVVAGDVVHVRPRAGASGEPAAPE